VLESVVATNEVKRETVGASVATTLKGIAFIICAFFAVVGFLLCLHEVHLWAGIGTGGRKHELSELARKVWEEFKYVLEKGPIFIGVVALTAALTKVNTISKLISDFIAARGPIYGLATTVTNVESAVSGLAGTTRRLLDLEPTIKKTSEKLEEILQQIADLQRLNISERTQDESVEQSAAASVIETDVDENYDRLRELWNANCQRIDAVRQAILHKARRARFAKMPRTNYPAIINQLALERLISDATKDHSIELHKTFMSYKSRNRSVPDEAIGRLVVLDRMLENELGQQGATPQAADFVVETDEPGILSSSPKHETQTSPR
jgi:hypothetical protein